MRLRTALLVRRYLRSAMRPGRSHQHATGLPRSEMPIPTVMHIGLPPWRSSRPDECFQATFQRTSGGTAIRDDVRKPPNSCRFVIQRAERERLQTATPRGGYPVTFVKRRSIQKRALEPESLGHVFAGQRRCGLRRHASLV